MATLWPNPTWKSWLWACRKMTLMEQGIFTRGRHKLFMAKVRQQESIRYAKAVLEAKQGQYMRCESVEKGKISCRDAPEYELLFGKA